MSTGRRIKLLRASTPSGGQAHGPGQGARRVGQQGLRRVVGVAMLVAGMVAGGSGIILSPALAQDGPIKVGILHSLSGTMAISEAPIKEIVLMAIEEINQAGGVLGRKVEPVIEDPASNWD